MSYENLLRSFLLCDDNLEDRLAWNEFLRLLKRSGHDGPLTKFVQGYLREKDSEDISGSRVKFVKEAWEPLISQGFVLFIRGASQCRSVFHVGRLEIDGVWSTKSYPDGWQYGEVYGLCHADPGALYDLGNRGFGRRFAWTPRKTPWKGHEHLPCKACLKDIHRLPWDDVTQLTQEQVDKIRGLRNG